MTDTFSILSKVHMVLVLLFVISMFIKTILIFKSNESFDNYRAKTKMPEMLVTILFLVIGIVLIVMKGGGFHTLFYVKLGAVLAGIPLGIVGAKKHSKVLVALSTVFFLAAYGLSEVAKKKAVIQHVETENNAELGNKLFIANCSSCHGVDGTYGLAGATNLQTSVLDSASAFIVVQKGRNNMPGFGEGSVTPKEDQLTNTEISAVVNYIATLKTK